jgi:glutathione S-transferase
MMATAMRATLRRLPISASGAMVGKLLHYKGVEFDEVEVDLVAAREQLLASIDLFVTELTLDDREKISSAERIALRLEELYPEPTILPLDQRGIQIALARYLNSLDGEFWNLALPDTIAWFRGLGAEYEAAFRQITDLHSGAGFCARVEREPPTSTTRLVHLLAPFEAALEGKAFLMGRIGLADFALYGELYLLGLSGELKLPASFPNLRAFHGRIDRISASLDDLDD